MLIPQLLAQVASKNAARPAYRYLAKETSFADLKSRVARLSYLYQNELGHGARVAFLARNAPAFLQSFFALCNTRSMTIPMDPDRPPEEIVAWLKASGATHLAITSDLVAPAREILSSARLSLPIVEIEKKQGGEYDTSFTAPTDNQPAETDVVLALRTAGSTGTPKLATFTHKQIQQAAASLRGLYHVSPTDRFLTTLTWSHPFAFLHGMLFPILSGASVVIDHGMEAVEFLNFLTESRVNRILGNPQFFRKLLMTCRNEKRTLAGVKSVTVAGGTLTEDVIRVFGLMKIGVGHCYGQTENLWTISMQDTELQTESPMGGFLDSELGVQKGLPGFKYKVVDANGDEIPGPDLRTGRLAVSTPSIMTSYYRHGQEKKDLELETKSKVRGSWLYTGDIAKLEGEGDSLRILPLGRQPDLLKWGDDYLSMNDANLVLKSVQGVDDAAAFLGKTGRGDPIVLCAVVRAGAVTDKQILDLCARKLPPELTPKAVVFTEAIPKEFGNTPNYSKLRSQFSGIAG